MKHKKDSHRWGKGRRENRKKKKNTVHEVSMSTLPIYIYDVLRVYAKSPVLSWPTSEDAHNLTPHKTGNTSQTICTCTRTMQAHV